MSPSIKHRKKGEEEILRSLKAMITFCLLIGFVLTPHELAHMFSALALGVKVEQLSFGAGPSLITWQGNLAEYSINLFPIGGFVTIDLVSLEKVSLVAKLIVVLSGLLASYLMLLICSWISLFINPKNREGLRGAGVLTWLLSGLYLSISIFREIFKNLKEHGTKNVGGPVSLFDVSYDLADWIREKQWVKVNNLLMFFTAFLILLNLLPLPILDGGRAIMYIIKAITGPSVWFTIAGAASMGILSTLLIVFTYRDVRRIVKNKIKK